VTSSNVIIVGAGPVGLAAAYGLARAGVEVIVLEKEAGTNNSPRAMAYLYPVLEGFERWDLLDALRAEGVRAEGMNIIDYETGEQFRQYLDAIEGLVPYPYVLQLGQDQISRILLERLGGLANTVVRYGTEMTAIKQDDDGVRVTVTGLGGPETLAAAWVIGADGASSAVRRELGLDFDGFTWSDRFVATNIRYDFAGQGLPTANWRIDPVYGAVIAQINDTGLWRFTFREDADLPVDGLEERIHRHFETALPGGGDYELVQFAPYRMHQRAAETFRVGRVLLAGDAAHATNPIGGLGLTGGFLDAFVLAEALAAVIDGRVGGSVLDAYAEKRRRVFLDIVSPQASGYKRMVFDPPAGDGKAALLAQLRLLATDIELRREDLLRARAIVTPSLLTEGER
jgi:3-(3-hydroxy-phenyl)propionate hydroxylase